MAGKTPLWLAMLEDGQGRAEMQRLGVPGRAGPRAPAPSILAPVALPGSTPEGAAAAQTGRLAPDQFQQLLAAVWRQSELFMLPFVVGAVPLRLRPAEKRTYLFLQNQSLLNNMALGFNEPPGPVASVPTAGVVIPANFGFYEPLNCPQGEVWIVAAAANTPGILVYAAI